MRASADGTDVTTALSSDEITELRTALDETRAEHRRRVDLVEADGTVVDADPGSAAGEAARSQEALIEIEAALERLDAGTYGRCEGCGATVPFARLEVLPAARTCVGCSASRGRPGLG